MRSRTVRATCRREPARRNPSSSGRSISLEPWPARSRLQGLFHSSKENAHSEAFCPGKLCGPPVGIAHPGIGRRTATETSRPPLSGAAPWRPLPPRLNRRLDFSHGPGGRPGSYATNSELSSIIMRQCPFVAGGQRQTLLIDCARICPQQARGTPWLAAHERDQRCAIQGKPKHSRVTRCCVPAPPGLLVLARRSTRGGCRGPRCRRQTGLEPPPG